MSNEIQRKVAVQIGMTVPETLREIILRRVCGSVFETCESGIAHNENEVLFFTRIYRKYHQDASFGEVLDQEFLKASTQRRGLSGIEEGTVASISDYANFLYEFGHPVMDEIRKGIDVYDFRKGGEANG